MILPCKFTCCFGEEIDAENDTSACKMEEVPCSSHGASKLLFFSPASYGVFIFFLQVKAANRGWWFA